MPVLETSCIGLFNAKCVFAIINLTLEEDRERVPQAIILSEIKYLSRRTSINSFAGAVRNHFQLSDQSSTRMTIILIDQRFANLLQFQALGAARDFSKQPGTPIQSCTWTTDSPSINELEGIQSGIFPRLQLPPCQTTDGMNRQFYFCTVANHLLAPPIKTKATLRSSASFPRTSFTDGSKAALLNPSVTSP